MVRGGKMTAIGAASPLVVLCHKVPQLGDSGGPARVREVAVTDMRGDPKLLAELREVLMELFGPK